MHYSQIEEVFIKMLIVENLEIWKRGKEKNCHLLDTINIFISIQVNEASNVSKFTWRHDGPGFGSDLVVVCSPLGFLKVFFT